MALKLITAPASYPVTLERAKQHLRVVDSDEDDLIEMLLGAATRYAEEFTGRALIDQTWELVLDEFPEDEIEIPKPPLIEIVSITYDDADGAAQTLSEDEYTVDDANEPAWVVSADEWPTDTFEGINSVRIRFRAGYVDAGSSPETSNVEKDIIAAILLHLGSLYAHRETVVIGQTAVTIPFGAEQLLRMHRVDLSMA